MGTPGEEKRVEGGSSPFGNWRRGKPGGGMFKRLRSKRGTSSVQRRGRDFFLKNGPFKPSRLLDTLLCASPGKPDPRHSRQTKKRRGRKQ